MNSCIASFRWKPIRSNSASLHLQWHSSVLLKVDWLFPPKIRSIRKRTHFALFNLNGDRRFFFSGSQKIDLFEFERRTNAWNFLISLCVSHEAHSIVCSRIKWIIGSFVCLMSWKYQWKSKIEWACERIMINKSNANCDMAAVPSMEITCERYGNVRARSHWRIGLCVVIEWIICCIWIFTARISNEEQINGLNLQLRLYGKSIAHHDSFYA